MVILRALGFSGGNVCRRVQLDSKKDKCAAVDTEAESSGVVEQQEQVSPVSAPAW